MKAAANPGAGLSRGQVSINIINNITQITYHTNGKKNSTTTAKQGPSQSPTNYSSQPMTAKAGTVNSPIMLDSETIQHMVNLGLSREEV